MMRAKFGLPSIEAEETVVEKRPPIRVKFEIPYFTVSGIQVLGFYVGCVPLFSESKSFGLEFPLVIFELRPKGSASSLGLLPRLSVVFVSKPGRFRLLSHSLQEPRPEFPFL